MNIGEANKVATVLGWITGRPSPAGPITSEQAQEAAEFLSGRIRKALAAGITAEEIRAQWPGTTTPQTPGPASSQPTDQNGTQ